MIRNITTPEPALDPDWIYLIPASARTGRSVRDLLGLVHDGRLPAFVDRCDGHRRLVFRADDLDLVGPAA